MRATIDRTWKASALAAVSAITGIAAPCVTASAQRSALGIVAESRRLTAPEGDAALSSWLGLAGRFDLPRLVFDARASAGAAGDGVVGLDLDGRLRTGTPLAGRLGLFAEVRGRDARFLGTHTRSFGSDVRLAWSGGAGGVFLGADAGRDAPSLPWGRSSTGVGLGGWRSFGDLVVSLGITDRRAMSARTARSVGPRSVADSTWNDTLDVFEHWTRIEPGTTDSSSRVASWQEMTLGAHWWRPWLTISARAGVRLASSRESRAPWADIEATVPLSGRFAAVAMGGWQPVATLARDRQASFFALGFRLLPKPLHHRALPLGVSVPAGALTISGTPAGDRMIRVRAPMARVVELSADFTGWKPIPLEVTRDGDWATRLRIASGTYRVAVRIDGGRWVAPPGTPRVADDFGGESGMIVVR